MSNLASLPSSTEEEDIFWNSNLEDIEAPALRNHEKISDLPEYLNQAVPHQGSVLLNRIYREKKDKPFFASIFSWLKK